MVGYCIRLIFCLCFLPAVEFTSIVNDSFTFRYLGIDQVARRPVFSYLVLKKLSFIVYLFVELFIFVFFVLNVFFFGIGGV